MSVNECYSKSKVPITSHGIPACICQTIYLVGICLKIVVESIKNFFLDKKIKKHREHLENDKSG